MQDYVNTNATPPAVCAPAGSSATLACMTEAVSTTSTRLSRAAEIALGAVFLAGAVLKALDINLVTVQIRAYGLFSDPTLLACAALGTLLIETGLGIALVSGLRLRGGTFAALVALLAVFTGLIAYGWIYNDLADCGCFGPIEMSPRVSIAKNVILLLIAAVAWHGASKHSARPWIKAFVATVAALALAGYAYAHLENVPIVPENPVDDTQPGPFAEFVFDADGIHYDLGKGEFFIVMLNTTCEHCMASVESVNELSLAADFPQVVGICYEEEPGLLDTFRDMTAPIFPLYSLGDRIRLFFSLVGEVPPRFILARDGEQIAYWDETAPTAEQVQQARDGLWTPPEPESQAPAN
ncbi:MAG: hypothetical protein QG656_2070 [Candidatus Hydrogenedentes bacterium]|nr:hypothetical protein [Candidatus Hydrogenedentota bacterium]